MAETEVRAVLEAENRAKSEVRQATQQVRDLQDQVEKLRRKTKQSNTQAKEFNQTLGRLRRIAAAAGVAIGAAGVVRAMGSFARAGIAFNRQIENAVIQLKAFTGDAQSAKKHIAELTEFAAKTPFQLTDLTQASRMLKVFRADAALGSETLRILGDTAAGVAQPIEAVSMWFGRLYDGLRAGRPIGEAAQRLQEMGILSGEVRTRLENLSKTGEDASDVLLAAFGRFDGSMKELSQTTGGLESTFWDLTAQLAGAVSESLGLDRAWKGFLRTYNEAVTAFVEGPELTPDEARIQQITRALNRYYGQVRIGANQEQRINELIRERNDLLIKQRANHEAAFNAGKIAAEAREFAEQQAAAAAEAAAEAAEIERDKAEKAAKEEEARLKREIAAYEEFVERKLRARERLRIDARRRGTAGLPLAGPGGPGGRAFLQEGGLTATIDADEVFRAAEGVSEMYAEFMRADEAAAKFRETLKAAIGIANKVGQAIGGLVGAAISGIGKLIVAFKTLETTAQKAWAAASLGISLGIGLISRWIRGNKEAERAARKHRREIAALSRELQGIPEPDDTLTKYLEAYLRIPPAMRDVTGATDRVAQVFIDAALAGQTLNATMLSIVRSSESLTTTLADLERQRTFIQQTRDLAILNRRLKDLQDQLDTVIAKFDALRDEARAVYDSAIKGIDAEEERERSAHDAALDRMDVEERRARELHAAALKRLDEEQEGIRDLINLEGRRHESAVRSQRERIRQAQRAERLSGGIPGALRQYGLTGAQLGGGVLARTAALDFQTFAREMGGLLQAGADPRALLGASSTADPRNTIRATLTRGVGQAQRAGIAVPEQLRALVEAAGLGGGVRFGSGLTPEQEALRAEEERLAALEQAFRDQTEAFQAQLVTIQERRERAEEAWRNEQAAADAKRESMRAAWEAVQAGFEARRAAAESALQTTITNIDRVQAEETAPILRDIKQAEEDRDIILEQRWQAQLSAWAREEQEVVDQIALLQAIANNTAPIASIGERGWKDITDEGHFDPDTHDPETGLPYGVNPTPMAGGGRAEAHRPYWTGERGPELFVPRTAGNIVPNEKLPIQVNVHMQEDRHGRWRLKQITNALGDSNVVA